MEESEGAKMYSQKSYSYFVTIYIHVYIRFPYSPGHSDLQLLLIVFARPAGSALHASNLVVSPMQIYDILRPSLLVKPIHVLSHHTTYVAMLLQGCQGIVGGIGTCRGKKAPAGKAARPIAGTLPGIANELGVLHGYVAFAV